METQQVPQKENDSVLTQEEESKETNTAQETNEEPMVATVSAQGQEQQPELHSEVTPSSHGRQRKKNPKFLDYETDEKPDKQSPRQKRPRKSPVKKISVEGEEPGKTPVKRRRASKAAEPKAEGDQEATPHESVGETSQNSSKKTPVAKKTPAKRTPAKKKAANGKDASAVKVGDADTEQQEKETPKPKPKQKYVKKWVTKEEVSAETPAFHEDQTPAAPEDETVPGGRPRRGAAKAALKYLHFLAKEAYDNPDDSGSRPGASSRSPSPDSQPGPVRKGPKGGKGRGRGQKRKVPDFDSDNVDEDEDFVPDGDEDEEMEEEDDSDVDVDFEPIEKTPASQRLNRSIQGQMKQWGKAPNGLPNNMMNPVWESYKANKTFREEHCSSWVFPEWVPSVNDWHVVPESEMEKYLPQELQSAAFQVSREGLGMATPLQRLNRFEATDAHPDRWDMFFFAGGPVWAIEWSPSPDGATDNQYVALACHQGMDDQHYVNRTYSGSGLIQLWDLGKLEYDSRPESRPSVAYGLAQDKGFVWQLKWCPSGAWELPTCSRKAPFLPRLGLLAVATSTGVVTIYSLPHPDALHSSKKLPDSGQASPAPPLYKAKGVLTLKLGSLKAPHNAKSGQVLSMDWLPVKPHNIMVIGFYDGIVGLWDLSSRSSLLRLREADSSLTVLPYRCFQAHDNAVRALVLCPASRYLLVTAGDDRMVKTWDLRRIYEPLTVQKRNLSTEVCWPLRGPGLFLSQENAYAPNGLHGVHYHDMGYHNIRSLFVIPRLGTVWSICFNDWLNGLVTSDTIGEVIFALLPELTSNHQNIRRTIERRFPLYFTDMVPFHSNTTEEESQAVEEAGGVDGKEKGGETEAADAPAEVQKDSVASDTRGEKERPSGDHLPHTHQTYRDAVKKYYLHYSDNDMRTFKNYQTRAPWKRMQATEVKAKIDLDVMQMAALYKVHFNPNMSGHTWVLSAGQAGLVRVHCLRNMNSSHIQKMVSESQAQFNALFSPQEQGEEVDIEAVQTTTQLL
ncbi:general transcription factor 3C polypeptide 2 [Polymixia lowei]